MFLINGKLLRFLVLALVIVFVSSPVFAGDDKKAANEQKAVKEEKASNPGPVEIKEAQKGSVAVVNGTAISQDDFDREFLGIEEQAASRGEKLDEAGLAEAKIKILEKLIDGELLYQESRKMGIKVEDSVVDEQYAKFKEQFPNAEDFNKELAKVKLTEASLKSQIRQVMMIQQYIDKEFVQKITVSEEELKAFYEAYLKDKIEKNIKQQKIQNEVGSFIQKLREKAKIEMNLR